MDINFDELDINIIISSIVSQIQNIGYVISNLYKYYLVDDANGDVSLTNKRDNVSYVISNRNILEIIDYLTKNIENNNKNLNKIIAKKQ